MLTSIELQVISRLLTTDSDEDISTLLEFDPSYYSVFKQHIEFIQDHHQKYGNIPDVFTFQAEFPDITLVTVREPLEFLVGEMQRNKQHILLIETFNKLKDLGSGDITHAWDYLTRQCDKAAALDSARPMDLVRDANLRAEQVIQYSKQTRIPTGFPEIDKLMYGGLSTVEELLLIVARLGSGKSWVCTRMMEAAQSAGFPVLYYSPEMQASYLGTRFDTWRGHYQNSQLYQGRYTDQYLQYLTKLSQEETSAFVLEDKDMSSGEVNTQGIERLVKRYGIKLLLIDGLSYVADAKRGDTDYIRYKNICLDLFRLSKKYGCAVVIAMQANRETKDMKDDKGEPFPNLYAVEGSDHPARIATQAFSLRQIFDKHVLDIRLEKSRMANNQKPVLSYAWDVNTGNMQYLPGGDDDPVSTVITPPASFTNLTTTLHSNAPTPAASDLPFDMDDSDVEF